MKKMQRWLRALLFSLVALGFPAFAVANTILVNSDLLSESNNLTSQNVIIAWPYPLYIDAAGNQYGWALNGENYFWISYADTGYTPPWGTGPHAPWPPNVSDVTTQLPTAIFYENFDLPYDNNTGSITIWADDTAQVYLGFMGSGATGYSYSLLWSANPIQDQYCADGPIGCEPDEGFTFSIADYNFGAGSYQLMIDAYQVDSGPFGVMYTGQIASTPIPESTSLLLLATGIAAFGLAALRRK